MEITDKWLRYSNPWEIMWPELAFDVPFGDRMEQWTDDRDRQRVRWVPETVVKGVAHDTPILGYRVGTCNRMRLWKAGAIESFDFDAFNHGDYWPRNFCNITNGVTPRRFVARSNPLLAQLLTDRIGEGWLTDLNKLRKLETFAEDPGFQQEWRGVKHVAKQRLAGLIEKRTGVVVDPKPLFDIQAKRIHKYKRQHLNLLHVLTFYLRLQRASQADVPARTFVFGGEAAPGCFMAELIIRLINDVAEKTNTDSSLSDRLKVVFFPDYKVKDAQPIYPAADLSEQISLAGKEASGTGNMKFSLNGALTVGTLDSANVEIREEIGPKNFLLFGSTAEEVRNQKERGYQPRNFYEQNAELRGVIDFAASGALAGGDKNLFRPLVDNLIGSHPFFVLADYQAYVECQTKVNKLWWDPQAWIRTSILNVAQMGKFSSDRSIRDYCRDIWQVRPMYVRMEAIEPIYPK